MALYALCLQPFLQLLGQQLPGIRIEHRSRPISAVAYADDATIFATSTKDLDIISRVVTLYERATGATLNPHKSKALSVTGWGPPGLPLEIAYEPAVIILGITFVNTIKQTTKATWARITAKVRAQAKEAYSKCTFIANRTRYVNTYLLSNIWYAAQILSTPKVFTQQPTTTISWYMFRGAMFRVPISTLQKPKRCGG
jgi:hypothetical protein